MYACASKLKELLPAREGRVRPVRVTWNLDPLGLVFEGEKVSQPV
jgi:hypothetical protein